MSVDLGQVVGRGIKSITVSGTNMTILYTDDTSNVFDISNQFDVVDAVVDNSVQAITSNAVNDAFNYKLIQDATGDKGGSIKFYANAFEVIVVCSGLFSNLNANGLTTIGSLSSANSAYLPKEDYAFSGECSVQTERDTSVFIRKSDRAIGVINNTAHVSLTIYGVIRYPLASRMP